jgi:hypothetical protein
MDSMTANSKQPGRGFTVIRVHNFVALQVDTRIHEEKNSGNFSHARIFPSGSSFRRNG